VVDTFPDLVETVGARTTATLQEGFELRGRTADDER